MLASILTAAYQSNLHLTHLPAAEADSARSSVAVAAHLGGVVAAQAHNAFADGMHLALLIAAGIAIAAAIAVGTLLRGLDRAEEDIPRRDRDSVRDDHSRTNTVSPPLPRSSQRIVVSSP